MKAQKKLKNGYFNTSHVNVNLAYKAENLNADAFQYISC